MYARLRDYHEEQISEEYTTTASPNISGSEEGMYVMQSFLKSQEESRGTCLILLGGNADAFFCSLYVDGLEYGTRAVLSILNPDEGSQDILILYQRKKNALAEFTGFLTSTQYTEKEFVGPMKNKSMKEFIRAVTLDLVHVHVYTKKRNLVLSGNVEFTTDINY